MPIISVMRSRILHGIYIVTVTVIDEHGQAFFATSKSGLSSLIQGMVDVLDDKVESSTFEEKVKPPC